jgi:hypothetical protein
MSKAQKINQDFLITDNSVNCYGFRMLTEGYLIAEYKKNPIGYNMHLRDSGVVVKWEDFRIEGDKVFAKPVINLSHPRGQQTVDEIENGFLNAASVGHIVALEISDDPALKLPNQQGPTITKWFNRECSLVDIGGNFNAVALYDSNEKVINLADFSKNKLPNMNEIKLTPAQLAQLNLKADADATLVAQTINDLVAKAGKADKLQLQLDNLTKEAKEKQVADLLAGGLKDKKLTIALSAKLKETYGNNPEGLKDLIDALPVYASVAAQAGASSGHDKRIADLSAKSYNDLMATGESETLAKLAPDVWNEKVKEHRGE